MRLRLVDLDGNEPLTDIAGAGPGIGYRRLDCRDLGPRLRLWTTRRTFRAFAREELLPLLHRAWQYSLAETAEKWHPKARESRRK